MSLVGIITGIEFIQDLALEWTVRTLKNCGMTFKSLVNGCQCDRYFLSKVIEALSTLCDDSKVHEFEVTRKVIREAFGDELEEYFKEFNQEPLASGSMAQVYRAK